MPDRYGFDHLGDTLRCIDCPTGGPLGHWPEHRRASHAHTHQRRAEVRPQTNLNVLPSNDQHEEKEATAMAPAGRGESAKQVAINILRHAGTPLPAKEIATQILASGRCTALKGKTPEATISAMLAVGSKPDGPFTRVDKGTYTLADTATTASTPTEAKPPAAAAKRTTARESLHQ